MSNLNIDDAHVLQRHQRGPFDCIGDIHGCCEELIALLESLGYVQRAGGYHHPAGRTVIFLGDLVDRGPDTPGVLRIAMAMVETGDALCLAGNHDDKLLRSLNGRQVRINHGLAESLAQLAGEPPAFVRTAQAFLERLPSHMVLDEGRLVAAHAGMPASLQGETTRRARSVGLYGLTTGESDAFGMPVRLDWAAAYTGRALVVFGHTPVPEPLWRNNTVNIDTGCVFGGRLTALRYPERTFVSVPAQRAYAVPGRPFLTGGARPPEGG